MSVEFNTLLVPIDFSPTSLRALEQALELASGESPSVVALHVIDQNLVEFAVTHGLGDRDSVLEVMRNRAESELKACIGLALGDQGRGVEVEPIVSQGVPFLEIVRKAEEFVVDAIVMGKIGERGGLEKLLFGTTAERVLRASSRPVIVLPTTIEE